MTLHSNSFTLHRVGWPLAFALGLLCQSGAARAQPDEKALEVHPAIEASIQALLRPAPLDPQRPAHALSWDCLAAAALASEGRPEARVKLAQLAQRLEAIVERDPGGNARGWGTKTSSARCEPGEYDAFNDGSCNPASTVYAFQSGLGMACLSAAARILGEPKHLRLAESVLAYWRQFALANKDCDDCMHFAISDHRNDAGRIVRNMSMFMGYGAAELARSTGKEQYKDVATRVLRSDIAERLGGNRGYLSMLDPDWRRLPREAQRIENHTAAMAVLSLAMAESLKSKEASGHAKSLWRDWATCSNEACLTKTCSYWAGNADTCQETLTAAHCAFQDSEPLARRNCIQLLSRSKSLPSFGILSLSLGGLTKR